MGSQHRWPCWLFWQPAISTFACGNKVLFCFVCFVFCCSWVLERTGCQSEKCGICSSSKHQIDNMNVLPADGLELHSSSSVAVNASLHQWHGRSFACRSDQGQSPKAKFPARRLFCRAGPANG